MQRDWLTEFTGRSHEVQRLRRVLARENESRIIFFSGIGGLGKTWLLNKLITECTEEQGVLTAHLDFAEHPSASPIEILSSVCEQLGVEGFPKSRGVIDAYFAKLQEIFQNIGSINISGSVSVTIDSSTFLGDVGDIAGVKITQAQSSVPEAELRYLERMFLERASQAFISELVQLSKSNPVRVFIDSLDQIEGPGSAHFTTITNWLREILRHIFERDLNSSRLLIFFARRKGADWLQPMPALRGKIWTVELSYFASDEVDRYLDKRGLGELPSATVTSLVDLTKGHPQCVALAADFLEDIIADGESPSPQVFQSYRGHFDERLISHFLMKRILERIPPETASLIRQLAIPHWFDAGTVRVLNPEQSTISVLLDTVTKYSFVRRLPKRGYSYHDIIRELLMRQWAHDDFNELSRKCCILADYFQELWRGKRLIGSREHLQVEISFHQLLCDAESALPQISHLFDDAQRAYRISLCEAIVGSVDEATALVDGLSQWSAFFRNKLFFMQGKWDEAVAGLKSLTSTHHDAVCSPLLLAEIYASIGSVMQGRGDLDQAIEMLKRSLEIRRRLNDTPGMIRTLNELGTTYRTRIEWQEATDCYSEARKLALKTDPDKFAVDIAYSSLYIGVIHTGQGDYDSALESYENSLAIYMRLNDQYGIARVNQRFGWITRIRGDVESSLHYHELALEAFRRLGYPHSLAECLHSKGTVHRLRKEYAETEAHYGEALHIFRDLKATRHIGIVFNDMGALYQAKGELDQAIEAYEHSLQIRMAANQEREAGTTLNNLGDLFTELGEWSRAEEFLKRGLAIARRIDCAINIVRALVSLCDLYYRQGKFEYINELAEEAGTLGERDGYNHYVAKLYRIYGAAYLHSGNYQQAARTFVRSLIFAQRYNVTLVGEIVRFIYSTVKPEIKPLIKDEMLCVLSNQCSSIAVATLLEKEIMEGFS